ncbi:DUF6252 family protein [Bernardetia sp. MNP-M8]|uniref:DUF6252 family protein n=1 Tax=Bernardetia sp. MNP-M8 TaxID=3127470 RepID=UPI0030D07D0D
MKTTKKIFSAFNFSKLFILLLVCSIAFVGCKDDDEDENPNEGTELAGGSMSAKVDGQAFEATLAVQATISGGVFTFAGTANSSSSVRQINIVIADYQGTGTYTFNSPASTAVWSEGTTADKIFTANFILGSGQVNITEVADGRAKGTFEFTGSNGSETRTITEGKFNVKI